MNPHPTYTPPRYYYPIWKELKEKGQSSVTANRLLHPRIIKAVTKEKWSDLGFKIELDGKIAILSSSRKHAVLTFYLTIKQDTLDFRSRGPVTIEDV